MAGQPLHFVRVLTPGPGGGAPLPLLLLHGWPGSFLEFGDAIDRLAGAGRALDIVCPSLPGYGFSSRSLDEDLPPRAIADRMAALMTALGHDRFVVQGGDWGSVIATELGRHHADRLRGLHVNLVPVILAPDDPLRRTDDPREQARIARSDRMGRDGAGYQMIQRTRPQTLAVALADSPLGLLAWIAEKFLAWSGRGADGRSLARDEAILDHVALYWLTNSMGSAMRLYRDATRHPSEATRVAVPSGVAVYPDEIMQAPRAAVERRYALVHWAEPARGGHFAAMEVPDLFVADLLAFLDTLETHDAGA